MKKKHVNIDFSDIHDDALSEFAQGVEIGLTDNAVTFPDLPFAVSVVKLQRQDFDQKLVKALNGNSTDTANKDAARKVLDKSMKKNGKYVDDIADGDAAIILSSGYKISKDPAPIGEFHAPDSIKVGNGDNAGEFDVDIAPVKKAAGYLVAFTPESNTEPNPADWTIRWTKKHRHTFTGLQSGTKYKVAAAAVGTSDSINFSNPVTRIAQ